MVMHKWHIHDANTSQEQAKEQLRIKEITQHYTHMETYPVCCPTLPLKLREKSKWVCEVLHFGAWERLHKKVSGHVLSRTIYKLNGAIFNWVANEMPLNINVFCLGMEVPLRMSKCNGRLVIQVKNDGVFEWTKYFAKSPEPNKFFGSMGCGDVLCFHGRKSDKLLFL